MSEARTTTDHATIQHWIEERGGQPASVVGTGADNQPGILRVDFPPDDDRLEEVNWDGFFEKFDQEELAFLYQEETSDGEMSRFCKFVRKPR